MGLIYSSGDSSQLIDALKNNIASGKEAVEQLKTGSQRVVEAVDGKTLAGAAYTAGAGLFSELVIPTISKVTTAIEQVEKDLTSYKTADDDVSGEGYLNEDNLNKQIETKKAMKASVDSSIALKTSLETNNPSVATLNDILGAKKNLMSMSDSLEDGIKELEEKLEKLRKFDASISGLFSDSLSDMNLAMQGVTVLTNTTVNSDGSYALPKGTDKSWFAKIQPNAKSIMEQSSSNAFLDLYKQVEDLLNPLTSGKNDNIKRFEMLLRAYPAAVVKKLLANDEFWMLANKLPSSWQTKFINGLAKYEEFGQAVASMKWIPKVDTLGKGYEMFVKATNPIKTYVSEGLNNSQFIKGVKNIGATKWLGKAATVATYAQLGVTFVSSSVDNYGKTGSIGKGVIGGALDTVKSMGPLEFMTVLSGFGPVGIGVGALIGTANVVAQFINPNLYSDIKDGAYKLYDEGTKIVKDIGKGISQKVDTVKNVFNDVQKTGKSIGKALSSIKIPKLSFGW